MFISEWADDALNELADHWTNSDSATRELITQVAAVIDRRLELNGPDEGESRDDEHVRVLLQFPLGVEFEVDLPHGRVLVRRCWLFQARK